MPVRVGEVYSVDIDAMGSSGDGIGTVEGLRIFVPGTTPGDNVLVEVQELKRNYARGGLLKILRPSSNRVQYLCHAATKCGGCQLMHVSYEAQLSLKEELVRDALERIGKLKNVKIKPILGMSPPEHYRNKAQFPIRQVNSRVEMGFFVSGTHDVVDIEGCHIQHPLINSVYKVIKPLLSGVSIYDEASHTGLLRHVAIRVSVTKEEALVIFVTSEAGFPEKERIASLLMKECPQVVGVVQNINSKRTNVIFGDKTRIIKGKDFIVEDIGGLSFRISPLSFFQVNTVQMEVLYSKIMEYAGLTGAEQVIDAYCGSGTISLFLARESEITWGIEEMSEAISMAHINAKLNGIENVNFISGKVEDFLPKLYKQGLKADLIVTDPPRKGCERIVLETFAAMGSQHIIYVSCNPATLARDLAYLEELGYLTQEVQPVDMFPFTHHVECVTLMSRVEK